MLIAAVGLVPILALLFDALPQADDFCLAGTWRDFGFWDGYWHLWRTWTARMTLIPLMMAPPALAEATGLDLATSYRLLLVAMLTMLVLAARWIAALLLPWTTLPLRWGVALLLVFTLAGNARSLRDLLYWLGVNSYYLPAGLAIGLCFLLLVRPRLGRAGATAAVLLGLLAGLSVEFGGVFACLVAAAAWKIVGRTRQAACLAVAAAGLAGLLFLVLAPGNAARQASSGQVGDIGRMLLESLPESLQFLAFAQSSPGLLGWLLLLVALGAASAVEAPPAGIGRARPLLWPAVLLVLALPLSAFALGLGAAGLVLPSRAQNCFQVALLPILSWLALRWGAQWRPRWVSGRPARLATVLLLLASPNAWVALAELPQAAAYAASGEARLAALAAPGPANQSFPPLAAYPVLLHQEDLNRDPDRWVNLCAAEFFDRETVWLDNSHAAPPDGGQPYWFLWLF